ncbi:unnamed protein product [Phytomonas sp. EM1]|nr:unnamed protein product [Phytomonas sp. EM1]|eukprot:CCW63570.1 unnamed protein product [Phytomonas sp. isolate EM1]
MLFDILDMTASYIQNLLLLFAMVPDALSELRFEIKTLVEQFELSFFHRLDENQRYDKRFLGIDLPLWLPLNTNLEFATLCIVVPLGLSLVSVLALESKLIFVWFVAMLVSLFTFTFGMLLWTQIGEINVWDGQHITKIKTNMNGSFAAVGANTIDPAISVRIWMTCTGAVGCLALIVIWIWPLRRALQKKNAKIRDQLRQFEREEEEKKSKRSRCTLSSTRGCGQVSLDDKDSSGVEAEAWMTAKALAEHRLREWGRQQTIQNSNHADMVLQMAFACALFVFGLICVNAIPLAREGELHEIQTSVVARTVGAISLTLSVLAALWGLLGLSRSGRALQLVLAECASIILLKLTMLAASFMYIIITTNMVSMLSCYEVVCKSGTRLPNARTHFPYLYKRTYPEPARRNINDTINNMMESISLSGCVMCNAFDFEQRSPEDLIQTVCNRTTREFRILSDTRAPCNSKRTLSLVSELSISILYILFLPFFQYSISRYAIRRVKEDFPIEQRFVDILSTKELIMEKLNTCDNEASFLYRAYKPEFGYFKISFLIQRVILAVISFVVSYDINQFHRWIGIFLFMTICLIMAGILIVLRPFSFPTETIYFPTTQIMIAIASLLLLMNPHGGIARPYSNLLVILLVLVPLTVLAIAFIIGLRDERSRYERLLERLKTRFIVGQRYLQSAMVGATRPGSSETPQRVTNERSTESANSIHPTVYELPSGLTMESVVTGFNSEMSYPSFRAFTDTTTFRNDQENEKPSRLHFRLLTPENSSREMGQSGEIAPFSGSASLISLSKVILPELVTPCPEYDLSLRLFMPSLYFIQPLRRVYGQEQRGLELSPHTSMELPRCTSVLGLTTDLSATDSFEMTSMMTMEFNSTQYVEEEEVGKGRGASGSPAPPSNGGSLGRRIVNRMRRLKNSVLGFIPFLRGRGVELGATNQRPADSSLQNLHRTTLQDARTMFINIGRSITCRPSGVLQKVYFTYLKYQHILHEKRFLLKNPRGEHAYRRYRQLHMQLLHSLDKTVLTHMEIMEVRRLSDLNTVDALRKGTAMDDPLLLSIFGPLQARKRSSQLKKQCPTIPGSRDVDLADAMSGTVCFPGNISVYNVYVLSKMCSIFNERNVSRNVSNPILEGSPSNNTNQWKVFSSPEDAQSSSKQLSPVPATVNVSVPNHKDLIAHRMFAMINRVLQRQEQGKIHMLWKESRNLSGESQDHSGGACCINESARRESGEQRGLFQNKSPGMIAPARKNVSGRSPKPPTLLPMPVTRRPNRRGSILTSASVSEMSEETYSLQPKWLAQATKRLHTMRSHAKQHLERESPSMPIHEASDSDDELSEEEPSDWRSDASSSSSSSSYNEAADLFQNLLQTHEAELLAELKQGPHSAIHESDVAKAMRAKHGLLPQLQTQDSETGERSRSICPEFSDTVSPSRRTRATPPKLKRVVGRTPGGGSDRTRAMRLRCHYIKRQASRAAYFKGAEQLLLVQRTIDKKIDAAVGGMFSRLFMILGIVATIAIALTIGGMLYEIDRSYLDGTQESGNGLSYALAGYASWEDFTRHCVCIASNRSIAVFPFYITDVEEWICANGMTKERVRRSISADNGEVFHDGYAIRPLCGMNFLAGCQLDVVTPADTSEEAFVALVGCPKEFSAEQRKRW